MVVSGSTTAVAAGEGAAVTFVPLVSTPETWNTSSARPVPGVTIDGVMVCVHVYVHASPGESVLSLLPPTSGPRTSGEQAARPESLIVRLDWRKLASPALKIL